MEMFGIHPWAVRAHLGLAGATLLRVEEDGDGEPPWRLPLLGDQEHPLTSATG